MKAMKFKGGTLIYKCRNCGKEYEEVHVPDVNFALLAITGDFQHKEIVDEFYKTCEWAKEFNRKDLTAIHFCSEKVFGVADLIGGETD